jgi:hypothetical protein
MKKRLKKKNLLKVAQEVEIPTIFLLPFFYLELKLIPVKVGFLLSLLERILASE